MNKILSDLKKKFSAIENTSVKYSIGKKEYLAIRLDGVRFTLRYSRKEFIPHKMNSMIGESVFKTYQNIFKKHEHKHKNLVLCVIQANDEVTFVFNKGNNKFDRRIFKILSIVNGLMSSWSTNFIINSQPKDKPVSTQVEYYDARPIILNNFKDIIEYTKYRYLTAKKHALAKTLKFNGVEINPRIWDNISLSNKMVTDNKLHSEFNKIEETFKIYIPDDNCNLIISSLTDKFVTESLEDKLIKSSQLVSKQVR